MQRADGTPGPQLTAALKTLLLAVIVALHSGGASADNTAPESPPARPAAVRWTDPVYRWYYNRGSEPAWLEPGLGLRLFQSAAALWADCGVHIEYAGETELPVARIDGANVAGWAPLQAPGLRGITRMRRKGTALLEADIAINSVHPQLRASVELLRKVVLHEFGHALGLVHSENCNDVMSIGAACRHIPPAALPQRPAEGDLLQCIERYGSRPTASQH
jgi:Matrixin